MKRLKSKQGYDARLDERLGMEHRGPKKQSYKERRAESRGMKKAMEKRSSCPYK